MNLKSFTKFAAVSAVALSAAMYASGVIAASIQIGDAMDVNVNATVENTIDVVITDIDLGEIGSMNDTVDIATFTLAPDGTITDDPGNGFGNTDPASIVNNPDVASTPGTIDVTNAFFNTDLYATYDNCTDITDGTDTFTLLSIADDMTTPGSYDCVADVLVAGVASTDGTGALTINLGVSITTDQAANAAYTDGAYTGDFDMFLSY